MIDASGLGSTVRSSLGLTTRSKQGVDRWCISDVRFHDPVPPERWTWVQAPFNEGRAVWQHQMADGVWRIDYQMDPTMSAEESGSEEVAIARVRGASGREDRYRIGVGGGRGAYRTHLMDDFRHGRVFFSGDAAHVFSPFGARGGNSGIQDAENLVWKLAAVLRGQGGEALLDSYNTERRAAAAFNIMTTERSVRFLAPESPFERALREATLSLARQYEFARRIVDMGRMSVPFVYAQSPLTTNGGDALPNVRLRLPDGRDGSVADLLRSGEIVVLLGEGAAAPPGVRGLAIGSDLAGEAIAKLVPPGTVLVLRPDQHVAARLEYPDAGAILAAMARAGSVGQQAAEIAA